MKEVDVESTHDINEETVDVLQCFIVGPQSFDKLRRRLHKSLREHSIADVVQQQTPFRNVRSIVRSAEEEYTKSGNID